MSVLGAALTLPFAAALEPIPDPFGMAVAMVPGALAVVGSLLWWQALKVGRLSLVSPTIAMNAGIAAVLAVLAVCLLSSRPLRVLAAPVIHDLILAPVGCRTRARGHGGPLGDAVTTRGRRALP